MTNKTAALLFDIDQIIGRQNYSEIQKTSKEVDELYASFLPTRMI